jgi:biotin-(acetyl-CoA carboxylase) ligase
MSSPATSRDDPIASGRKKPRREQDQEQPKTKTERDKDRTDQVHLFNPTQSSTSNSALPYESQATMMNQPADDLKDLSLPPVYRPVFVEAGVASHDRACELAPHRGAGTLVVRAHDALVDFAVVLEPDEPLGTARRVFFACMAALVDAVAIHAPPEKPLDIGYPATLYCDGAMIGGGRIATPPNADEGIRPDWLVFSAQLSLHRDHDKQAGLHPFSTSLREEGFEDLTARPYIESFTRHLMTHIDRMQHRNFKQVAETYLKLLKSEDKRAQFQIDPYGNLLARINAHSRPKTEPLLPRAALPDWFDPATGMPRL